MQVKEGVSLAGLKRVMRPALIAAEEIWERNGEVLEVIAHMEGKHSAYSVHWYGFALDFCTEDCEEDTRRIIFNDLAARLNPDFTCKQRPNHVHVEYNFWEYSR